MKVQLQTIDTAARKFADARDVLSGEVSILNAAVEELHRKHIPSIRKAVARCSDLHAELKSQVEQVPDLFVKPRTVTLHGIKIGYQKGKGGVIIEDPDRTVELIRKHIPDRFDDLVQTSYKPLASALNNLEAVFVRKIGCEIANATDEIVIRPTDSAVDKIVNRLLTEATEEGES